MAALFCAFALLKNAKLSLSPAGKANFSESILSCVIAFSKDNITELTS